MKTVTRYELQQAVASIKELMHARDESRQLAIDKAEKSMNDRLEGMNEFRRQIDKIVATFPDKDKLQAIVDQFNVKADSEKNMIIEKIFAELNIMKTSNEAEKKAIMKLVEDMETKKVDVLMDWKANITGRTAILFIVWTFVGSILISVFVYFAISFLRGK